MSDWLKSYLSIIFAVLVFIFCWQMAERSDKIENTRMQLEQLSLQAAIDFVSEEYTSGPESIAPVPDITLEDKLNKLGWHYDKKFICFIEVYANLYEEITPELIFSMFACEKYLEECYEQNSIQIEQLAIQYKGTAGPLHTLIDNFDYSPEQFEIKMLIYFNVLINGYKISHDNQMESAEKSEDFDYITYTFLMMHNDDWGSGQPEPMIVYYNNFY